MPPEYFYEALPYSAAEVEMITGLTPTIQRDWRRRKLVQRPKRSGTGIMPQEVAEILIVQTLRDEFGLHLEIAAKHAADVAPMVLWFALTYRQAWDFDGTREEESEFRKFIEVKNGQGVAYLGEMVGAPTDSLKYYSIWHSGEWTVTSDVKDVFNFSSTEGFGGLVLNHDALGRKMFERIEKPVFIARRRRPKLGAPSAKARKR